MSIFNSLDSANLDFVCKARQVNALLEMAWNPLNGLCRPCVQIAH